MRHSSTACSSSGRKKLDLSPCCVCRLKRLARESFFSSAPPSTNPPALLFAPPAPSSSWLCNRDVVLADGKTSRRRDADRFEAKVATAKHKQEGKKKIAMLCAGREISLSRPPARGVTSSRNPPVARAVGGRPTGFCRESPEDAANLQVRALDCRPPISVDRRPYAGRLERPPKAKVVRTAGDSAQFEAASCRRAHGGGSEAAGFSSFPPLFHRAPFALLACSPARAYCTQTASSSRTPAGRVSAADSDE